MQEIYSEIQSKLRKLKQLDKNYCVFGSCSHKYELKDRLSEEEVRSFEELNEISLPKEYRDFLIELGNGGAGPGYKLIGIKLGKKDDTLKQKFLLNDDFRVDEYERGFDCLLDTEFDGECKDCKYKEQCLESMTLNGDEIDREKYGWGTLQISYSGCTYYNNLVLNGEYKGEIWHESEGQGILKSEERFLEFYMGWLDRHLQVFLNLKKLINEKKSFDELLESLDKTFLHFDSCKANAISGVACLGLIVRTNGVSGTEQTKQIEEIREAYKRIDW